MKIRSAWLILLSYLLSLATCGFFVLSIFQTYSDQDYVTNYLKCRPEADSVAIPIGGSFIVSFFFIGVHTVFHGLVYSNAFGSGKRPYVELSLRFREEEKWKGWIGKGICYALGVYFLLAYFIHFYKFYLYEAAYTLSLTGTFIAYGIIIALLFEKRPEPEDSPLQDAARDLPII